MTWVDRMASLRNFRGHVPGDVPTPDNQQPVPSTYMTLMYNLHYNLSSTHYNAPTGHYVVHGTDSLLTADYAPPSHNPGPGTYTREDEPGDPDILGTWERTSLDTLLSIRSRNQDLGKAMYCVAKCTQRTWEIPTDRWLWKVMLRPQQREGPSNRRGPTPRAPPPYSSACTWLQPASWRCCGRAQTPPPKTIPTSQRRRCPVSSDASSAASNASSKRTHTSCPPSSPPRSRRRMSLPSGCSLMALHPLAGTCEVSSRSCSLCSFLASLRPVIFPSLAATKYSSWST